MTERRLFGFLDSDGDLTGSIQYNTPGSGGAVNSVNGQTGDVVLDAEDVGALPEDTVIPSKTSDLTNDSGFLTEDDMEEAIGLDVVTNVSSSSTDSQIPTAKAVNTIVGAKYSKPVGGIPAADIADGVIPDSTEATGIPIVTSISAASTDSQVPTAKAVNTITSQKVNQTDFDSHVNNHNNPHQVTAAQIGLGTAFKLKGSVANISSLPSSDNTVGDVYYVTSESVGYVWINDGSTNRWEQLGLPIDLSAYRTASEQDAIDDAYDSHIANNNIHVTSTDKTNWDAKGTYSKPASGIPASDLAGGVLPSFDYDPEGNITKINNKFFAAKYDYNLNEISQYYASKSEVNAKYTKPSTGIPKSDLASAVQTSLNNADSAKASVDAAQQVSSKAYTLVHIEATDDNDVVHHYYVPDLGANG